MDLSRRDLLKAASRIAAAMDPQAAGVLRLQEAFGLEAEQ